MKKAKAKTTMEIRDAILNKALPDVIFDGWSMDSIAKAAADLGYDGLTIKAAFPAGIVDVLDAFADWADRKMLDTLGNSEDMRVRDRVRHALINRFELLSPHKEAVKASLKFWLNPLRKPRAAKITWRTADVIWDWAGDTSTDYNRYTKRGLLSGIIASATLVWINDDTFDMSKTNSFIDGRIENVMQLGQIISKFKK
jgi:ubiquinone biosynthesis protein COQ9